MVGYFLPSSGSAPGPLVRTTGTLLPGCASRVLHRHLFVLLQCILGGSWPDLPGLHVAVTQTACWGPFYLGCHAFHFQELGGFPSLLPSLLSASFLPSFLQKQQLVLIYGMVVPPPHFLVIGSELCSPSMLISLLAWAPGWSPLLLSKSLEGAVSTRSTPPHKPIYSSAQRAVGQGPGGGGLFRRMWGARLVLKFPGALPVPPVL